MRKNLISIIFVVFIATLISSSVFASQALPRYRINEQTKECSEFFMGDECVSCNIPEGWETIEEFQCPNGYNEIQADSVCMPRKDPFCCTVQHSGAAGDCEDVVVNDIEQKCAFVEDINKCAKLPTNWKQAEDVIEFWGKVCPSLEYEWLEETLDCETKIIDNDNIDNQNNIAGDNQQNPNTLLFIIGAVAIIILIIIIWFFLRKRLK